MEEPALVAVQAGEKEKQLIASPGKAVLHSPSVPEEKSPGFFFLFFFFAAASSFFCASLCDFLRWGGELCGVPDWTSYPTPLLVPGGSWFSLGQPLST